MYLETSSDDHGSDNVFISIERTDIIQNSNITFCYNRYLILNIDSKKSMGPFRIEILMEDNTWSTRYNILKNYRYSDVSTQWHLLSVNFTEKNSGIKLIYDQKNTPHADMCFSNVTKIHSAY